MEIAPDAVDLAALVRRVKAAIRVQAVHPRTGGFREGQRCDLQRVHLGRAGAGARFDPLPGAVEQGVETRSRGGETLASLVHEPLNARRPKEAPLDSCLCWRMSGTANWRKLRAMPARLAANVTKASGRKGKR